MTPTQLPDPHQQWVTKLFQTLLEILKGLDWPKQESPRLFLVYAHDNHAIDKKADAEVAQQLITWLSDLGADIYSDRTAIGNSSSLGQTLPDTAKVHDILSSQLCLLPKDSVAPKKVDHVILCGSELLGYYFSSEYYQKTYYPALKKAYKSDPKHPEGEIRICVDSQLQVKDFHHVLTELAFLKIRANKATHHGILPVLLNGKSEESFPQFIDHSTTIRIEVTAWREPGHYNGQKVYKDQGLHKGFFKLLKRLWVNRERTIQILGEGVYDECIQALQSPRAPESAEAFMSFMKQMALAAQDKLIQEANSTLRIFDNRQSLSQSFDKIRDTIKDTLQEKLTGPTIEPDTLRTALHQATRDRLTIQRVSGQTLPMAQCYINLAVVEHQPVEKEAKKASEEKSTPNFHRPPSFEAIEKTNLQKPIPLANLFNARRLNNGTTGVPQRILIRGRAGIGKTTLSKKSVYEYTEHELWRTQFDWLLWIPLRNLKGKLEDYPLEKLLYNEYFCGHNQGMAFAQALCQQIQKEPAKTLLILDGWDEVSQEQPIACLKGLLNHPTVIITSRPYGVDLSQIAPLDLELETIGFSPDNVTAYLDHPDIVQPAEAKEIKRFIQDKPFVRDLVNIPIQLDALCYSWDYIKREQTKAHTMTGLYQAMVHRLWRKDIPRLAKQENGKPLTAEAIDAIRRPSRLERLVQVESDCLGALALKGLHANQIEFTPNDLDDVIEQLETPDRPLPFTLEQNLNKLSCLHVERGAPAANPLSYHFLHLSFQEFFAALWLVKSLIQDKPLGLFQDSKVTAHDFIQRNKYNPRYELIWWFTAGLLSGEALTRFFETLDQGPQDLIGIQHQRLIMHCLQESNDRLPGKLQRSLKSNLYEWLRFEVKMDDGYYSTSSLGRQAAFPEALLCQLLEELSHQGQAKSIIARTLGQRPALSKEALTYLTALLKDEDKNVRGSSAYALGNRPALPPEALECLIALVKKGEEYNVRQLAARVLGQQRALSLEALDHLIALAKDKEGYVGESAAEALSKRPVWEFYCLLSTQEPSLLKEHYSQWLIKRNFQQIVPLYIEGDTLYFYTSMKLKSVSLTEETDFRRTILQAQTEVGIPSASRVKKLIPSTASRQGNAVSVSRTASSFSSTLFHRSEGSHDNEPHDNALNRSCIL